MEEKASKIKATKTKVTKTKTEKVSKEKDLEMTKKEYEEKIAKIEKEEKAKEKKETVNKIINVILWIVLICWMLICLTDFFKTTNKKDPIFCIKKETVSYDDGEVHSCLGLGYKIYNYQRSSFKAIEYGPFWSKDRSNEIDE